jgi:hypothetical protein
MWDELSLQEAQRKEREDGGQWAGVEAEVTSLGLGRLLANGTHPGRTPGRCLMNV